MNGDTGNRYLPYPRGFSTKAIHAGQDPAQWNSMCLIPPLVTSTSFKQHGPGKFKVSNKFYINTV